MINGIQYEYSEVMDVTLAEIVKSDKPTLTVADVAEALGTDAQGIRVAAHQDASMLGFPVVMCGRNGRRVLIPRIPFLKFMGVEV